MIPAFDASTGYLPPGEHSATWNEVEQRFGWNDGRRRILKGLLRLVSALRDGGCSFFLLDGSFVTAKESPSDFDACCDYSGMCAADLVSLHLMDSKAVMKAEYRGEVYPFDEAVPSDEAYTFREYFASDQDDLAKGVVLLDMTSVP